MLIVQPRAWSSAGHSCYLFTMFDFAKTLQSCQTKSKLRCKACSFKAIAQTLPLPSQPCYYPLVDRHRDMKPVLMMIEAEGDSRLRPF